VIVDEFVPPHPLKTPVLFLVLTGLILQNRYLKKFAKQSQPRLYIASDGPRDNKEGEKEKVEAVKKICFRTH